MAACLGSGFHYSDKRLHEVLEKGQSYALATGVSMKSSKEGDDGAMLAECAPFTLFPSLMARSSLQQIKDCMRDFNLLIHRVAHDHTFLESCLKNVIEVDSFTGGLWDVYTQVRKEGFTQPLSLGLNRNDFMLDTKDIDNIQPKQIEFNTIASSFSGLTSSLINVHRFTLDMIGKNFSHEQLPDNDPALGLSKGMVKAWEIYGNTEAVILFLVAGDETNIFDQRALEFKVHSINRHARVIRRTFQDVIKAGKLNGDKKLTIDGEEIAVIYFRSGYEPNVYSSTKEWEARLMMERSKAIKCPSIQYQLAGTKKIQQELARAGSVERFIKDKAAVKRIRETFVQQHSLDLGAEGDKGVELALRSPNNFVLKPQREGGGNNLYGEDIDTFLRKHQGSSERNAYILMERIFPPSQKNYLLKSGVPFDLSDVVSEIGVYGVYIGSAEEEVMNMECGHMMRTKTLGTDEGGICAGFAGLDSPFLIVDDQFKEQLLTN